MAAHDGKTRTVHVIYAFIHSIPLSDALYPLSAILSVVKVIPDS